MATALTTAATSCPIFSGESIERPTFTTGEEAANGALEVQIDDVESAFGHDAGRRRQGIGVGPANLPGTRRLGGLSIEQPQGAAIPAGDIGSVDPLGNHQPRPGLLHQQAEGEIRVFLHGGQGQARNGKRPDFH